MENYTSDKIRKILLNDDPGKDLDYIATEEDYRDEVENGAPFTISKYGIELMDYHAPFKSGHLIINVGHTNVGKSATMQWLLVQLAKTSGLKFLIYSAENRISAVVKRIIVFYLNKPWNLLNDNEKNQGFDWVKIHFMFILHVRMYTYKQLLHMATEAMDKNFEYDGMMIDPYNSLKLELKGLQKHDYNIQACEEMRVFCEMTKKSVLMNCHTATEYQRMLDKDNNTPRPLYSMAEGGAPFANKADDVWVTHRHVRDPERFMFTELYIDKVREQDYGGALTAWDKPIKLRFRKDRSGYDLEGSWEDKVIQNKEDQTVRIEAKRRLIPLQTAIEMGGPDESDDGLPF